MLLIDQRKVRHLLSHLDRSSTGCGINGAKKKSQTRRLDWLRFTIDISHHPDVVCENVRTVFNHGEMHRKTRTQSIQNRGVTHLEWHFHGVHVARDSFTRNDERRSFLVDLYDHAFGKVPRLGRRAVTHTSAETDRQ